MQILLIMTTILMHGAEVVRGRSDEQDVLPTLHLAPGPLCNRAYFVKRRS